MTRRLSHLGILALALGMSWGQSKKVAKTDSEIRQAIINKSIASYRGSCPPFERTATSRSRPW